MKAFRRTVGWAIFGLGIICIVGVVVVGLMCVALLMPLHRIATSFERPKRRYVAHANKAG